MKPGIFRKDGKWLCGDGLLFLYGSGETPEKSYQMYKAIQVQQMVALKAGIDKIMTNGVMPSINFNPFGKTWV